MVRSSMCLRGFAAARRITCGKGLTSGLAETGEDHDPRKLGSSRRPRKICPRCDMLAAPGSGGSCLDWLEFVFRRTADRAGPVSGNVLEGCSGFNPIGRIANGRIIFITTDTASVFLHTESSEVLVGMKLLPCSVLVGTATKAIPAPASVHHSDISGADGFYLHLAADQLFQRPCRLQYSLAVTAVASTQKKASGAIPGARFWR